MDKQTLSNYGWIVVMLLCLSVILATATPFGEYVGKGVSNFLKAFYQTAEKMTDEIEGKEEENDIELNGSFVVTNKEGNNVCYIYEINGKYDAYSLVEDGDTPQIHDRYYRCTRYVDIEERRDIKEMFYLVDELGYDDTIEEKQGVQYLLLHYLYDTDYSDTVSAISSTAKSVYDDLLSRKGTVKRTFYEDIELVALDKENHIDMIYVGKEKDNSVIKPNEPTVFGLYDANNVMLASWDDLVNKYGFTIENDLSPRSKGTMYYVIKNNSELSTGVKLVVGEDATKIGKYALAYSPLTTVILPNTITSIGAMAFMNCENLVSINMPDNLTSIGVGAFIDCTALTSIEIPNGVTEVKAGTFIRCKSLVNVELPKNLISIGHGAFHSNGFTNIDIPDSVITIEGNAFWNCTNLVSIEIPNGVTEIGDTTFAHCDSLSSVTLPNDITSIGDQAFLECYSLTSIDLPDKLTTIGLETFQDCTSLQTIKIPNTVTEIDKYAFNNTPWLDDRRAENPLVIVNDLVVDGRDCVGEVIVPSNIKKICANAFGDNEDKITSVVLPEGLTDIKYEAFGWCHKLVSINFPSTLKTIGDNAFNNCIGLTSITTLPNTLEIIGDSAFANSSLTEFIIPSSVKSIGDNVFYGGSNLKTIIIPSTTHIGAEAFTGTKWLTNKRQENPLVIVNNIVVDGVTYVGELTIPSTVTEIAGGAFARNHNLTSVVIPSSVKSIGAAAFALCDNLTSVTLAEGIEYINNSVFSGCSSLTTITLPSTLKTLGLYVFDNCTSLTTIYFKGTQEQWETFESHILLQNEYNIIFSN